MVTWEPNIHMDSKHSTDYLLNTSNKLSFSSDETNWYCVIPDVTEKYTASSIELYCQNVVTLIMRKQADKGAFNPFSFKVIADILCQVA